MNTAYYFMNNKRCIHGLVRIQNRWLVIPRMASRWRLIPAGIVKFFLRFLQTSSLTPHKYKFTIQICIKYKYKINWYP